MGLKESGKSTFIKQLRIIYGTGYTNEDKRSYIKSIYQNVFMAMQSIIRAMHVLQIPYSEISNKLNGDLISSINCDHVTILEKSHAEAIVDLWNDRGIQEAYKRRKEYHLADSAKYYFTQINRISSPNYLPTEQDILRVQTPTVGITECLLNIDERRFRIIDVGNRRSERRKWHHCFEDVTSVLFLVALSDYDQTSPNSDENRMEESKLLFKSIATCPWLWKSSIMVLLNKTDVFEEKIMYSDLKDYFPEYVGPRQDAIEGREFIRDMFHSLAIGKEYTTYCHFMSAINTERSELIFQAVRDTLLQCTALNVLL
ncbi:hypothetical protein Trydic_g19431 [Trypoxylus dichotomus]